ncbi:MAG TPA: type IX secretion system sortase PorU [Marinilabiliaceae bacterium]|nr:type IX secretion system sortase PorU [Marinilabiliaceae bacterium]
MRKIFIYIITVAFCFINGQVIAQSSNPPLADYKENSVIAQGKWLKISVEETGIHKIPYSTLSSWGFSNPKKIGVFGYGGQMIPVSNSEIRPDDLPELSVWHTDNALYFYANGPVSWRWNKLNNYFDHQLHTYSQKSYYFLSETSAPTKIQTEASINSIVDTEVTSFDFLDFHEKNLLNVLPAGKESGRKQFGEAFTIHGASERTFSFIVPNLITTEPINLSTGVAARSNEISYVDLYNKTSKITSLLVPKVNLNDYEGFYARESYTYTQFTSNSSVLDIKVAYSNPSASSTVWLDYLSINARAKLKIEGNQLVFRDMKSVKYGNVARFSITNSSSETLVWDVTDITSPKNMEVQKNGTNLTFISEVSELKTFVAFNPNTALPTPKVVGEIPNQNLHSITTADYVIVAPEEFRTYADQLADLHRTYSQLNPVIVTPEQIYNEFSWGHTDPTAIRSFMRMLYDRAGEDTSKQPKYLLLFGNGYYSNSSSNDPKQHTWIPAYQSENSIHQSQSYVTDDYYGFLDPMAGSNDASNMLRIGIGRFPVRTTKDAQIAVNKVENYLKNQIYGSWRKKITFIGDDEDNNIHVGDSDKLAEKVKVNQTDFEIEKIYLDNYTKTANDRYPEAQDAIDRTIANGTMLINYIGHGGVNGLSHELVITKASILSWKNHNQLPLFVTATCEFSRFDDPNNVSAGEEVFLNPNGGGIALLSTTRLAYSSLNYQLNNAFFNHVFKPISGNKRPSFGDIIKNTKNETRSTINKLNFVLLGDPALKLIYPENKINTTRINSNPVGEVLDTLKALSVASIEAEITDNEGTILHDFKGTVDITVYDKAQTVKTKGNKGQTPFEFSQYPNILFKGKAKVEEGKFSIEFMVPFDIRYNLDFGRISYYAVSDDGRDAMGSFTDFIVGGFNPDAEEDEEGPDMKLYLDHANFSNGDLTGMQPILYAELSDKSGINTSGSGIGHDLVLILNDDSANPILLNDYYQADEGTYCSGKLIYQLPVLPVGKHHFSLKAWDNFNNSSTVNVNFEVSNGKKLNIENFKWSPNPTKWDETNTISFETHEGNSVLDITITGFKPTGEATGSLTMQKVAANNFIQPFPLSLATLGIKESGFYLIRFHISSSTGKKTQLTHKIMALP